MGVLQHGRFILRWCGTPFLTKGWIHNRLEIENRLVLGSKIILKNWAKRAVIIPELSEPPVRTLGATIPENESHIFR